MAMSCSGCLLTYCFTACCNNITLSDNLQAKAIFHTGYNYAASCRMLPETVFRHYIFVSSDVDKFDFAVFLHMHIGALVVCILFVDSLHSMPVLENCNPKQCTACLDKTLRKTKKY